MDLIPNHPKYYIFKNYVASLKHRKQFEMPKYLEDKYNKPVIIQHSLTTLEQVRNCLSKLSESNKTKLIGEIINCNIYV